MFSSIKWPFKSLPHSKTQMTKFDLVKMAKVNRGSSFEQTVMGPSPRCYIPSLVEIDQLVPEKKIVKGFDHIYMQTWWPCDPGHVTQIPRTILCSPYPWRLYTKFGFKLIGKVVSEEKIKIISLSTFMPGIG